MSSFSIQPGRNIGLNHFNISKLNLLLPMCAHGTLTVVVYSVHFAANFKMNFLMFIKI